MTDPISDFVRCAALLQEADGLLITAGAGMSVDSGLPDFRGAEGFWSAYPALGKAGMRFQEIASPANFVTSPALAWGFYGHRLSLYRHTIPHEGFGILREIAANMAQGAFVSTSNVDGQFQKAGFADDRICEVHGSIHFLQCQSGCLGDVWPATDFTPEVDEARCLLTTPLPRCPHCNEIARPNILMFDDWAWKADRTNAQRARRDAWTSSTRKIVIIEIGAGIHVPTVRRFSETLARPLIRIKKGARLDLFPARKIISTISPAPLQSQAIHRDEPAVCHGVWLPAAGLSWLRSSHRSVNCPMAGSGSAPA